VKVGAAPDICMLGSECRRSGTKVL